MTRTTLPWALMLIALAISGCRDGTDATGPDPGAATAGTVGERIALGGSEALVWGDGDHGVVLAHGAAFDAASWAPQAIVMADLGTTVIAVEDISADGILAAVDHLEDELGVTGISLAGGSIGADAVLSLSSARPEAADQLILLSPNRVVDGLGPQPKLFIASEGEALVHVSQDLATSSPGADNVALLLPGSAHAQNVFDTDQGDVAMEAILDRLAPFVGP